MSIFEENNFIGRGDIADKLTAAAPLARERILNFRQVAEDRHAMLRPQLEKLSELAIDRQKLEARLRHITGPGFSPRLTPEDFQVRDVQGKIDQCKAEIARVSAIETERANRWRAAAGVAGIAEDYLASGIPQGCILVDHPPMDAAALLKKGENATDGIERIRRRGRELAAALHRVRSAPHPLAERKLAAKAQLAAMAEAARPNVSASICHGSAVEFPTERQRLDIHGGVGVTFARQVSVIGTLAWIFPREVEAAIYRELDEEADGDKESLTDEARAKLEAQIIGDALENDRAESAMIDLAAEQSIAVEHRSDISPLALLNAELITSPPRAAPPRSTILQTILGG